MKFEDLNLDGDNRRKAKRIAAKLKDKAMKQNPGDGDTVAGWRGDPHSGPINNPRITR